MQIYNTYDMEAAVRAMVERNHHAVVFWCYENRKRIRLRLNELADIPMTFIRSWDPFAKYSYERWRASGGLLVFMYSYKHTMHIDCDAMLMVEAPITHERFTSRTAGVKRELIIYRPPTWELHEDTVLYYNPHSMVYRTVVATVRGLVGRDLDDEGAVALKMSGFDPAKTAVFRSLDILSITGVEEPQLRRVLKNQLFRQRYVRYHLYSLNLEPEDPAMLWAYKLLEEDPDRVDGVRMLRFDHMARGRVNGFPKQLKRLVKQGYVTRGRNVYVVMLGFREPSYNAIDAVANSRRGEWFKMRNIIDEAQEYMI